MKRYLYLFIIILTLSTISLYIYHERKLLVENNSIIVASNNEIVDEYEKFNSNLSDTYKFLEEMKSFFESDPAIIPEIYDKYYRLLNEINNKIIEIENSEQKLDELCKKISDNKVCLIYKGNIIEVKNNYISATANFNNTILKYNEMSLSDYEIYR